mmetsp:Transcript_22662/g.51932  ORF Transcript_22662/g.51932 Transcript_22662/m.51932 type:complete len:119 (-) Transcript_22662:213-569(-)
MNLPASAVEFLDVYRGYSPPFSSLANSEENSCSPKMPRVHVHAFVTKEVQDKMEEEILQRIAKALGCELDRERDQFVMHVVRDVSPKKEMVCAEFFIPMEVMAVKSLIEEDEEEKIAT